MLLANLLFAFVDTSTKWLLATGLVVIQLAFMRYAVHFGFTLVLRGLSKAPPALAAKTHGLVLFRAFLLVSATVVNFTALGHLPLSITSAILFFSPVFVCLFAQPMLGERITPHQWGGVVTGFVGVLLIVWPFDATINWYAVLMLYPAAALAMYQVMTRMLAGVVEANVLQLYTGGLGTIVLLPFALLAWQAPASPMAWTLLFAIGAFAWAGHEALTRAHAYAAASTLAPFGYSFVIYLSLAGWYFFSEIPAMNVVLGTAFIFGAGALLWWRES